MNVSLVPKECLWCVNVRVVKDTCPKCNTVYGQKLVKKKVPPRVVVIGNAKEWTRVCAIRIKWEI